MHVLVVYLGTNLHCLDSDVFSEINPKHLRRILPIHAVGPVPPVQWIGQALPEVAGVALKWGSERVQKTGVLWRL